MAKKIVCLGDSITYGYGAYPEDAWPARASALTGMELINCGINGDTAAGMLWRFYEDVAALKPDICLVMAGANDLLNGQSPGETAETIRAIADKAKRYGIVPVIAIPIGIDVEMIGGCWPCARGSRGTAKMFELLAIILKAMENDGIQIVDVYTEYQKRMAQCCPGRPWYQDGVHPTREGYHVLGEIFADFIRAQGWET